MNELLIVLIALIMLSLLFIGIMWSHLLGTLEEIDSTLERIAKAIERADDNQSQLRGTLEKINSTLEQTTRAIEGNTLEKIAASLERIASR